MRIELFCNQIGGCSFVPAMAPALLGLVCGMTACSGFAGVDCATSRTCAPADAGSSNADYDGAAAGRGQPGDDATGAGGVAASPGGAAAGGQVGASSTVSSGGTGEPAAHAAAPDAGSSDHGSGHGGKEDDDGTGVADAGGDGAAPLICTAPRTDCNGDRGDGCEVDLSVTAAHCGACATACSTAGTSSTDCVAGVCKPKCDSNHADCDGDPKNGCEVDISTDANACGACSHACSKLNATAAVCVAGVCKPTCGTGHGDCSSPKAPMSDNGCESDLTTEASCGACGHDCQGGACQAGQCQPTAIMTGLTSPSMLAVDAKYSYVLAFDSVFPEGHVIRVGGVDDHNSWAGSYTIAPSALVGDAKGIYLAYPSSAASSDPPNGEIDFIATGIPDAVILKSGIDPRGLAVDGKNVYWSDFVSNGVFQQSLDSRKTVTQLTTTDSLALTLVSDGTTLFAANSSGNKLYSVPVGGGALTQLTGIVGMSLSTATRYIAVDAKYTYAWFYGASGAVHLEQLTKPGFGNAREIASGTVNSFLTPMAVDANHVYFSKDQGLYRAPTTTNGPASSIAKVVGTIAGVAVLNGALYWLDTGSSSTDGTLYRLVL